MSQSKESSNNAVSSNLQLVPETILRQRHDLDEMNARRTAQEILRPRGNRKVFSHKTRVIKVRKPEAILAAARMRRYHAIRMERVGKKGMQSRASDKSLIKIKVFYPFGHEHEKESSSRKKEVKMAVNSVGAKMVFCIRIRNHRGVPEKVKKVLNQFRLRQEHHGVFLRYDNSTRKLLHMVEPWVTYGIPLNATVSDLLHRRGHIQLEKKCVTISDNTLIEQALSKKTNGSIICVQDLVHELVSVGDYFHVANACLSPFCLSPPNSKYQKKTLNFQDGGEYGDRGEEMDDYIRYML